MLAVDTLFTHAHVYTMDAAHPRARSIAVLHGRVVALDDDAESLPAREVVDLGGRTVLPGFNDAHSHLVQTGERLLQIDATAAALPTMAAFLAALAAAAADPATEWVRGGGFDQLALGGWPQLADLDRVAAGKPVWVTHASGHMAVANSAALRAAGLDPADPPGGLIGGGEFVRDAAGDFTGLVTEGAMRLVDAVLRPPPYEHWLRCIEVGSRHAVSLGITSATDASMVGPGITGARPDEVGVYFDAWRLGRRDVRMTLNPEALAVASYTDRPGVGAGIKTGFGDAFTRIGATKFYLDGSLLGQTAAVTEPFLTNGSRGAFTEDPEVLREKLIGAHANGWQVACHAIGDAAVELAVSAYEEAQRRHPRANARHRIEHTAMSTPEHVRRIAALGAIPVPQAHFVGRFGDLMREALGDDRVPMAYRQRSFLEAGIVVPGSSDGPVAEMSPLLGIHDLVNRTTASGYVFGPEERLSVEDALRCYTVNSAFTSFEEDVKGRLAPGFFADMVVLDDDPMVVDPAGLAEIGVLRTVIDGRTVFEAD